MPERIICIQCGRERSEKEFFMRKDHVRSTICKECLTAYIDNNDPETFKWILEKFDVPYIEHDWKEEAQKAYDKNPAKFGPSSVIGRYLRRMNMTQYRNYTYADTVRLAEEAKQKDENAQARVQLSDEEEQQEFMDLQAKLDAGQISQSEFDTLNPLTRGVENTPKKQYTFEQQQNLIDEDNLAAELTPEDKRMLSLKWGFIYKPSEWIKMEDMYNKYANEYELNVDREESLKQICKLALKMDQALDLGDASTYKSLQASYDSLRKSAKFTEVQNKEEQTRYLDSIGELVRFCEKEGGAIEQIPYPDDYPQDDIDYAIKNMKSYYYDLVTNELGLGNMIEAYIKRLEQSEQDDIDFDANMVTSAEEEEEYANDLEAQEFAESLDNIEDEIAEILGEV